MSEQTLELIKDHLKDGIENVTFEDFEEGFTLLANLPITEEHASDVCNVAFDLLLVSESLKEKDHDTTEQSKSIKDIIFMCMRHMDFEDENRLFDRIRNMGYGKFVDENFMSLSPSNAKLAVNELYKSYVREKRYHVENLPNIATTRAKRQHKVYMRELNDVRKRLTKTYKKLIMLEEEHPQIFEGINLLNILYGDPKSLRDFYYAYMLHSGRVPGDMDTWYEEYINALNDWKNIRLLGDVFGWLTRVENARMDFYNLLMDVRILNDVLDLFFRYFETLDDLGVVNSIIKQYPECFGVFQNIVSEELSSDRDNESDMEYVLTRYDFGRGNIFSSMVRIYAGMITPKQY